MNSAKAVGAGAFVVLGGLLFTAALFMIGERRMLFADRFPLYTEFARLGQLENGAAVRVGGMDAGEVTAIEIPASPAGKFRVRMEVRKDLHQLIRTDSMATTQTEGLVGAVYVNIAAGTERAARVREGGTIAGREPFLLSDLMQQASETVDLLNETVKSLGGDLEEAIQEVTATTGDARAMLQQVRPDIVAMSRNGSQISANAAAIVAGLNSGEGTIGKLLKDDTLYQRASAIATDARAVMENVREVSNEARRALADFRSTDGPAQGLMADMRLTLSQAREATADLADNMEALKHNFLLRGFFNRRGYYDLDTISPVDYRTGVLENGKRKAMRIWLNAAVLFAPGPDGTVTLTDAGRTRIESAMATYLEYLPAHPVIVEGYATEGGTAERYRLARQRAGVVREYILGRYEVPPQHTGFIALGDEAAGSPGGERWDGVAITLFLSRDELQFVRQEAAGN